MKLEFNRFPVLTTERLELREITENDSKEVFFLRSDLEMNKYIKRPETKNISDAIHFLQKITKGMKKGENITWKICLKGDPKMIGSICLWNFSLDRLKAEVGYDLHYDFQNKGIMSEALKCILKFGFEKFELEEIEAYTHYENESSKRLLQKNRFKLIKNKKDANNADNLVYVIKKSEAQ